MFVGKYNEEQNSDSCLPHSAPCAPGYFEQESATRTSDRVCAICSKGTYAATAGLKECEVCLALLRYIPFDDRNVPPEHFRVQ